MATQMARLRAAWTNVFDDTIEYDDTSEFDTDISSAEEDEDEEDGDRGMRWMLLPWSSERQRLGVKDVRLKEEWSDCMCIVAAMSVHSLNGLFYWWMAAHLDGFPVPQAEAAVFGCMFILCGVVVPGLAWGLVKSQAFRILLTLGAMYSNTVAGDLQLRQHMYNQTRKLMQPLGVMCALSVPVFSYCHMSEHPDEKGMWKFTPFYVASFVSMVVWTLIMLFFGPSTLSEAALTASEKIIRGLTVELRLQRFWDIDWHMTAQKYQRVHMTLEKVWHPNNIGGIVIVRTALLFALSFACGIVGMRHPDRHMIWMYRIVGFIFAGAGATVLGRMALLTSLCMNGKMTSDSFRAVVQSYVAELPGSPEAGVCQQYLLYQSFLTHLQGNVMGVEFFGIAIDFALVYDMVCKVVIYSPVLMALLGDFFFQERQ